MQKSPGILLWCGEENSLNSWDKRRARCPPCSSSVWGGGLGAGCAQRREPGALWGSLCSKVSASEIFRMLKAFGKAQGLIVQGVMYMHQRINT